MLQRLTKTAMSASLGFLATLITYDNLVDYGANYAFVQHVLSMDTIAQNDPLVSRAVTSPRIWSLAYALIIGSEGLIALLFMIAAYALWAARRAPAMEFHRAKRWVHAAVAGSFLLWFVGFLVIGGEWFSMWRSPHWNGQEPAFRIVMIALAVMIYVNQPEETIEAR